MRMIAALLLLASPALAFEPGTHGEPMVEEGFFVGCFTGDEGGSACEIHARGAIFIVSSEGPSEPDAMNGLAGLAQGAPVKFTGDMIAMGDVTVDFALNTAEPNPADPLAPLVLALQGTWMQEGAGEVTITGLEWAETEGNAYLISFGTACSDGVERGGTHLSLYQQGGDPFFSICMEFQVQDANRFEFLDVATGAKVVLTR